MSKKEDLKKCPFCGEYAKVIDASKKLWGVKCSDWRDCKVELATFETEEEAIAAWNKRK